MEWFSVPNSCVNNQWHYMGELIVIYVIVCTYKKFYGSKLFPELVLAN